MNRLATFHKVGPGRGEHDGEKSFWIGSLICPAVRARSYAKMGVAQEGRRDFWLMANWGSIIPLVEVEPLFSFIDFIDPQILVICQKHTNFLLFGLNYNKMFIKMYSWIMILQNILQVLQNICRITEIKY